MMTRIIALVAITWVFTCIPFFLGGHVFLDPSREYGANKVFWVSVTQWLALLGPPAVLAFAALRSSRDADIDA